MLQGLEAVCPEGASRLDEVQDAVGQAGLRSQLDGALKVADVNLDSPGGEVPFGDAGLLWGNLQSHEVRVVSAEAFRLASRAGHHH